MTPNGRTPSNCFLPCVLMFSGNLPRIWTLIRDCSVCSVPLSGKSLVRSELHSSPALSLDHREYCDNIRLQITGVMSQERCRSSATRERPIIRSHSLYNPEASGPIVDEGYVAERVRAFEGIFNQHWIPVEKANPPQLVPELARDTRSRSSLRPFPPLHQYERPSSSLSSTYISLQDTPTQTRVRRLSRRRLGTFTASLSSDQTPVSKPPRQAVSDEQRRRARRYLARVQKVDEVASDTDMLRQKVGGMVAPYFCSPTRTRASSRTGADCLYDRRSVLTSPRLGISDPQPYAPPIVVFHETRCNPEDDSPTKKPQLRKRTKSILPQRTSDPAPKEDVNTKSGDFPASTTAIYNLGSVIQSCVADSPSSNKQDLDTSPSLRQQSYLTQSSTTTPRVSPNPRSGKTIGKLPANAWPPSPEVYKKSTVSLDALSPSISAPSPSPFSHEGYDRASLARNSAITHSPRTPCVSCNEYTSKIPIWNVNSKPCSTTASPARPMQDRPLLKGDVPGFGRAPPTAGIAAFNNPLPTLSRIPISSHTVKSETYGRFLGYPDGGLRNDICSLSGSVRRDQDIKANPVGYPDDMPSETLQDKAASSICLENKASTQNLVRTPPAMSADSIQPNNYFAGIMDSPVSVSDYPNQSLDRLQARDHSAVTVPKGSSSRASSVNSRSSSFSRLFRNMSSWRLVLVDKDKSDKDQEEARRQAALPTCTVGSTVEKPTGDGLVADKNMNRRQAERLMATQSKQREDHVLAFRERSIAESGSSRRLQNNSRDGNIAPRSSNCYSPQGTSITSPWAKALMQGRSQLSTHGMTNESSSAMATKSHGVLISPPPTAVTTGQSFTQPEPKSLESSASCRSSFEAMAPDNVQDPLHKSVSPQRNGSLFHHTSAGPSKPLRTPSGFRRIRPSSSWMKQSPKITPDRHQHYVFPTLQKAIDMDVRSGKTDSSVSSAAADSAPKVGSLAALSYIKNGIGNARRQPRPCVSLEVLPASPACAEENEGGNTLDTEHGNNRKEENMYSENIENGRANSSASNTSRSSMFMRRNIVRGERIKKVSVVVTLDGPADVRLDASVKKRRQGKSG